MADALTLRADRAARQRMRPAADRSTGLHALKLAQIRQQIRQGHPEAVEAALRSAGMLEAKDGETPPARPVSPAIADVRWFVAQTKPGAEGQAVKALTDAEFRACAPTVGYWAEVHRRDVVRVRYVFPRYCFVGLVPDARGAIDFRSPRLCDGVSGFVEGAGGRIEVRDTAIGDLMAATEMGWLGLIREKALRGAPKGTKSREEFLRTMASIVEADAAGRMRLFLQYFGVRRGLSERAFCGMSDTTG